MCNSILDWVGNSHNKFISQHSAFAAHSHGRALTHVAAFKHFCIPKYTPNLFVSRTDSEKCRMYSILFEPIPKFLFVEMTFNEMSVTKG